MFVFVLKEMSSLAERLRNRAERKPLYNDNESDEDLDLVHGGFRSAETKPERITRADAVCCVSYHPSYIALKFVHIKYVVNHF